MSLFVSIGRGPGKSRLPSYGLPRPIETNKDIHGSAGSTSAARERSRLAGRRRGARKGNRGGRLLDCQGRLPSATRSSARGEVSGGRQGAQAFSGCLQAQSGAGREPRGRAAYLLG